MIRDDSETGERSSLRHLPPATWVTLAGILAYAAAFRLLLIGRPFQYDAESWTAFNAALARNYLLFGWAISHGMPLLNAGVRSPITPVYYADHSPLVPLLIAPIFALFGVGEWQARLPTTIATLASVAMMFVLIARSGSARGALLAAALFAATPMTLYFGGMPDVLWMPLVLNALISVYAYLWFAASPGTGRLVVFCCAFLLAAASDWPAFILVPVFVLHFAGTRPSRQWRWAVVFGLFAACVFAAIYAYIAWATNAPWSWMLALLSKHTGVGSAEAITARQWLARAVAINRSRHTLVLIALAVAWLLAQVRPAARRQPGATAARLLLAWGVLHVAIGRLGVYNDDWWWAPLTPGLVVAAALVLDLLARQAPARRTALVTAATWLFVVAFGSWTTVRTWRDLHHADEDPRRAIVFGQAVRVAAPDLSSVSLVAGYNDMDVDAWFYADRAMRIGVWSVSDLHDQCVAASDDVMYNDTQPASPGANGIVVPLADSGDLAPLRQFLAASFRRAPLDPEAAKRYEVFDLRHTASGAALSAAQGCAVATTGAQSPAPGR